MRSSASIMCSVSQRSPAGLQQASGQAQQRRPPCPSAAAALFAPATTAGRARSGACACSRPRPRCRERHLPSAQLHLPHRAVGARAHRGQVLVTLGHLPHGLVQVLLIEAASLGHSAGSSSSSGHLEQPRKEEAEASQAGREEGAGRGSGRRRDAEGEGSKAERMNGGSPRSENDGEGASLPGTSRCFTRQLPAVSPLLADCTEGARLPVGKGGSRRGSQL